ncbi:MAG: Photosystem reaction center subunit [Klenkia sp.]|nr:Photosystem reaction center subunit [Klenkia sp.]
MIDTNSIDQVIGSDVYDADGDKIGTASEVFLDDQTGNPEWVTVKTGLFGTKSTFVPLRDADLADGGVRVPVSKAAVKDAPKVDADQHLSPEEEQELYRHYGFADNTAASTTDTRTAGVTGGVVGNDLDDRGTRTGGGTARLGDDLDDRGQHAARSTEDHDSTLTGTRNQAGTVGRDTSGPVTDDAMTRSEERLTVGTETTEVGRARLRKHVVTENVTRTVPVTHEEVRVEREPITDANRDSALAGGNLTEEEHEVTLHAERPVVEKETVPVERVRLGTETVTEEQRVQAEVAHEEIEQVQDGVDTTRGTDGRGTTR